jgi:replicative DNA helicase
MRKLYDIELEKICLGGVIIDGRMYAEIAHIFNPTLFYDPNHAEVAFVIQSLKNANKPVDIVTLVAELNRTGKMHGEITPFYITELTTRIASATNLEYHLRILQQMSMQRELVVQAEKTIQEVNEGGDVFELIESSEKRLSAITSNIVNLNFQDSASLWERMKVRNTRIRSMKGISGVPSGIFAIDKVMGGWQPSDLIILAARPGMGKTALALEFAKSPAMRQQIPTVFFSLEMSAEQVYARMQSQESDISIENILKKGLDDFEQRELSERAERLRTAPIYIDDSGGMTVFELKNKARKLVRDKKVKLIVIDYLQLMFSDKKGNQSREQEVSYISRSLKELAKELNVPVIALSQLSRSVETRGGGKVPMLSDLRDSGSIEQDADIVTFLYRPEYYGINSDEIGNSTAGKAVFIIAKHRNGSLEDLPLNFQGRITKFSD